MVLAIIVIVVGLVVIVHHNKQIQFETSFEKMLKEGNYSGALDIYREIQREATNPDNSQLSKNRFTETQKKYESLVHNKTEDILERLEKGDNLSKQDQAFILGMQEITSSIITPYLNTATEDLLDQKISYQEWRHFLDTFKGFPNLQLSVENLLEQEDELNIAVQKFAEVQELDLKSNWNQIWEKWSALSEDEEIGRFASHYASYRLQTFQDELYKVLMEDVDLYIEQDRYYTAKNVLDRLFDAFPNQSDIQEKLNICNEKIPSDLIVWEDPVECIGIKPLLVDTDQAKRGKAKTLAETELITVNEFKNLLLELYNNDYVLVSANVYFNYPDNFSQVVVPKGKKPIILLLESYQYSASLQEAGAVAKLGYDHENKTFHSYLEPDDPESVTTEAVDAISILEEFIQEYSDFSFNGAKALISLNVNNNILGYMIDSQQFNNYINDLSDLGLPISNIINLSDEEKDEILNNERDSLVEIIAGLKYHNYYFANGTYSNQELNLLEFEEFKAEIKNWEETAKPLVGDSQVLLFANGSHVYTDQDKTDYLKEKGYVNFYSQGAEAFNYMTENYIHLNYVPINHATLNSPSTWQLDRFFDSSKIIEDWSD